MEDLGLVRNHVTSDHTPPWPFLVGGVICLITSVDERYLVLLNGVTCDSSLITSRAKMITDMRGADFIVFQVN